MDGHIEQSASDTLLERGTPIPIRAPFFLRWFGKKVIHLMVKKVKFGTSLRVSSYYASTGLSTNYLENLTVDQANKLFALHGVLVTKIIACSIINSRIRGYLFTKILANYLRWNTEPQIMFDMVVFLVIHGGVKDFINIIRSAQTLTVTAPNLSQQVQGS